MPFKISENISKTLDFSLFSGATEWDQSSVIAKRVCVCVCGGGGGGKKPALGDICNSVICNSVVFLAFLPADKATRQVGVIRNITVLWGIMLLLSRHNQNPP